MLIRTLTTVVTATVLTVVLALFLSGQAFADSWKHGGGHGKGHGAYHKYGGYHGQESHWHGHGRHGHGRHGHWAPAYRPYRHGSVAFGWLFGPAFSQARPGEVLVWQDPDYGDRYQVTPTRDYQTAQGRYCREYQATATVGGQPQQTYGTACLQPDGSWQIVQ